MKIHRLVSVLALSTIALFAEAKERTQPNFIIIFTDDQGYADLSCFGGKHVNTPRIDQMAAEGAKLTSFYVAAPICTPSRAALMTGSYAKRVDMDYGTKFPVLLSGERKGLNPEEITIAEVLKAQGYKTGMFGKWHLGDHPDFMPTKQGFDQFWGIPYSHDIHPFHSQQKKYNFPPLPLLDGVEVIELDPDADYLTKRVTEKAVTFIKDNKDTPFFLYVPHPLPHVPLHASPEFMEDVSPGLKQKLEKEKGVDYYLREGLFRQAIAEIDWSVGQILDALKENGLDENTLVIFTSDNGPGRFGKGEMHSDPLKGIKGGTFEGGMRVPTVIRWPGKIPAGKNNDQLMTAMDLLPTFAKLAGGQAPTDRVIDGKDISSTLIEHTATPHQAFFYYDQRTLRAVRMGKWKLHLGKGGAGRLNSPIKALYDLDTDIGETNNLIADHPAVVQEMTDLAEKFEAELETNKRPAGFVK